MRASDLKTNFPEVGLGAPEPPQSNWSKPSLPNFAGGEDIADSGFDETELSTNPSDSTHASAESEGEHHGH
jgi:hypothetical protein